MQRVPTALIAAAAFLAGFGVADLTGVRPLGGLVLLAGAVLCARRWLPTVGAPTTWGLLTAAFLLFVASHPLGDLLGSWPAVLVVSAAAAGLAWRFADSRAAVAA